MFDKNDFIMNKIDSLADILDKIENNKNVNVIDIIYKEIEELKKQVTEIKRDKEDKMVVKAEEFLYKTRFFLKDGSTYVVTRKPERNYKYLFDIKSKIVTYEFDNGQIERTFENGLKEIRTPEGKIVIKNGPNDFDSVYSNRNTHK